MFKEEETPYTGLIEVKFPNGKTQALTSYRNGVVHGKGITYHQMEKYGQKKIIKNGVEDGVNIIYYENGNIEYEKKCNVINGRTVLWETLFFIR